jgi:hypothetical protein
MEGTCEYGNEHPGSESFGKFLSILSTSEFSRKVKLHVASSGLGSVADP